MNRPKKGSYEITNGPSQIDLIPNATPEQHRAAVRYVVSTADSPQQAAQLLDALGLMETAHRMWAERGRK